MLAHTIADHCHYYYRKLSKLYKMHNTACCALDQQTLCAFLVRTLPEEAWSTAALLHRTDRGLETRLCTTGVLCLCSRFFCVSDMLLRLCVQSRGIASKNRLNSKTINASSKATVPGTSSLVTIHRTQSRPEPLLSKKL